MVYTIYKMSGLTEAELNGIIEREKLSSKNRKVQAQKRMFEDLYDVELVREEREEPAELPYLTTDVKGQYFQLSLFRGDR